MEEPNLWGSSLEFPHHKGMLQPLDTCPTTPGATCGLKACSSSDMQCKTISSCYQNRPDGNNCTQSGPA